MLKLFCLQRRHALEEWMQKLLSDIDLSRSAPVAAFLELEAAARSCMFYLIHISPNCTLCIFLILYAKHISIELIILLY